MARWPGHPLRIYQGKGHTVGMVAYHCLTQAGEVAGGCEPAPGDNLVSWAMVWAPSEPWINCPDCAEALANLSQGSLLRPRTPVSCDIEGES